MGMIRGYKGVAPNGAMLFQMFYKSIISHLWSKSCAAAGVLKICACQMSQVSHYLQHKTCDKQGFRLKPANYSIIRPINGTAMNRKRIDLPFIAVGFTQRFSNDRLLALAQTLLVIFSLPNNYG
jgi:hypothetical protein